jgi:hypothetical protein
MAIVVSEYGKVLGLVTMDDLLAQIFGVIRDERAALQASNPNIRLPRARTPGVGNAVPGADTGPVPKEAAAVDTGPVAKEVTAAIGNEALDPPPPPCGPLFPEDEVTPPAVDVEISAQEKRR